MSLSVVMPVYNEAVQLAEALAELDAALDARLGAVEIIVVDDASDDGTQALLAELAPHYPRLRTVRHPVNRGHGAAILTGYRLSRHAAVCQIDGDRQFWPTDFWRLYAKLDRADLVVGVRTPRRDPRHRRLLSRLLRGCIRAVFGQRLADGNSPFRVMRRTFLAAQLPAIPETFPAPNLLLSLAAARHNTLAEVPVRHRARTAGRSTLLRLSLIRFCLTTLTRLLLYRLRAWPRLTS